MRDQTEQRMGESMGRLLRTGVILADAFVMAGGVVYLVRHPEPVTNYRMFQGEPEELRTVSGIFHGAFALHGRGLIQLGLLILIATPIARVAFSVVAFLYQRDWIYVAGSVMGLGLLVYTLLGGAG